MMTQGGYKFAWLLMAGMLLFMQAAASAPARLPVLNMFVGDMQVLRPGAIKRVAVGVDKVISTSILDEGQLLILAEGKGETLLRLWLEDGRQQRYKINVAERDVHQASKEARSALRNLPSVTLRRVGGNLIVEGVVDEQGKALIKQISGAYKLIDLTTTNSDGLVSQVLSPYPNVKVRKVGKYAVVEGHVTKAQQGLIEKVKKAFPNVLDLSQLRRLEPKKMVYMKVQMTEFNRSRIRELGIAWDSAIPGPKAVFERNFATRRGLSVSNNITGVATAGYFGIATEIASKINLAISNGDAILLAAPTLSARSGGKAEFLSGGEIPIPVPGPNLTTTIEFKKFGIILKVEPEAGDNGNILAKVETEVSTVDQSVSVENTPGFRTRRASTEVSLQSGQTLVISGLVNRELASDMSGLPWLHSMPVLGPLFRSTKFRNAKSDLVIFITPIIQKAEQALNQDELEREQDLRTQFLETLELKPEILD